MASIRLARASNRTIHLDSRTCDYPVAPGSRREWRRSPGSVPRLDAPQDGPLLRERRGKPHGRARASGDAIVASIATRTRRALRARHLRDPSRLGSDGSHLAATLFHLAHGGAAPMFGPSKHPDGPDPSTIYARVANRLTDLIDDVREVGVEVDPQRELWTLFARGKDGTKHPARASRMGRSASSRWRSSNSTPSPKGSSAWRSPRTASTRNASPRC